MIHVGGEPASFSCVLLEGAWRNERGVRAANAPLEAERDTPGTWFGGIEFVDVMAPMTARALRDAQQARVPSAVMLELARENPSLARHLMSGVRAGMTWFLEHLEREAKTENAVLDTSSRD